MSLKSTYQSRKNLLAQNLTTMGVTSSGTEGLTTLIDKVLDVPQQGLIIHEDTNTYTTSPSNLNIDLPITKNFKVSFEINYTNSSSSYINLNFEKQNDSNNYIFIGKNNNNNTLSIYQHTTGGNQYLGGVGEGTTNTWITIELYNVEGGLLFKQGNNYYLKTDLGYIPAYLNTGYIAHGSIRNIIVQLL